MKFVAFLVARAWIALFLFSTGIYGATLISFSDDGSATVQIPGLNVKRIAVEATSNLTDWETVTNASFEGEIVSFVDTQRTGANARFYRIFEPPFSAPQSISRITVALTESILGASIYTVQLSGGSSGVFAATSGSEYAGSGSFTYVPYGAAGHLVLNYMGPFTGDFDDFTLQFSEDSHTGPLSGFQKVGNMNGLAVGTFSVE